MNQRQETFWSTAAQHHGHAVVVALLAAGVRLDDARELAQEAWTRLLESAHHGRLGRVELPGLAIRQAMFLLAERRRVLNRRVMVEASEAAELVAHGPLPDEVVAARQILGVVSAEVACLSARGQAVLGAVVDEPGRPQVELATRQGISLQRFRQVLCEARARLRAVVDAEEASRVGQKEAGP